MNMTGEQLLKAAPPLTDGEKEAINRLFQPLIFRRKRTREIWTSCCRQHHVITPGYRAEEDRLMQEVHTPEPIVRMYWTKPRNEFESSRRVRCPWCGAEAKLKELGSCGNRKNLWSYRRAVVLRAYRGKLWAIAYDAVKDYKGGGRLDGSCLTAPPKIERLEVYRFEKSRAYEAHEEWSGYRIKAVDQPGKKRSWMLSAPYGCSTEYGTGYDIIGMRELEKTEFRYCGIPELVEKGCDLLRLLTLCCFYPRQVEFLAKLGFTDTVRDYTEHGVKSCGAVQWDAARAKDFLGVSVKEAQALLEKGGGVEALRVYRAMKPSGGATIEESILFEKAFDGRTQKTIRAKAKKYGITIGKLMRYIDAQREKRGKQATAYAIGEEYRDYLIAAEGVGLDLYNPIFLMPKDLRKKHDEVTAAYSQLLAEKRRAEEEAAYRERREKLEQKYAFVYGGMCVVIPSCANAIIQEGKQLHHCVGGYADRHIKGKTTILFLRREETPKKPLVTMEMCGNSVVQIHGWDDERTACKENPKRESCRSLYREFLEVWKAWLKAGSKRNKDGTPKLPRKLQEVKTA